MNIHLSSISSISNSSLSSTSSTSTSSVNNTDSTSSSSTTRHETLSLAHIEQTGEGVRRQTPSVESTQIQQGVEMRMVSDAIKKLNWPSYYRSMVVKRVIPLDLINLMKLLRENKLLGAKGELEFLYFIGEGNWNTFDADANSKFRIFRENLKLCIKEHLKASYQNVPTPEILEQRYLELDKRFNITLRLTCLSMLASQKVLNESIVGRFMSIEPSVQITSDTERRPLFQKTIPLLLSWVTTVYSVLQVRITDAHYDQELQSLEKHVTHHPNEVVRKILKQGHSSEATQFFAENLPFFEGVSTRDIYREFVDQMPGLRRIFTSQCKVLITRLNTCMHQSQVDRLGPSIQFQILQVLSVLRFLNRTLLQMSMKTRAIVHELKVCISLEREKEIIKDLNLWFLDDGVRQSSMNHRMKDISFHVKFGIEHYKEGKSLEGKLKVKQCDQHIAEGHLILNDQLENCKRLQHRSFMWYLIQTSPLLAGFMRHPNVCGTLKRFFELQYYLEAYLTNVRAWEMSLGYSGLLGILMSKGVEIDESELWLQSLLCDLTPLVTSATAETSDQKESVTTAKPKRKNRKKTSKNVAICHSISSSSSSSTTSSSSSTTTSIEKSVHVVSSTYLQRLQGLQSDISGKSSVYLSDAFYHLGVFGSNIDLLKTCLSMGQRQFFPELLFGCFRSGAMMNEQLLTHFLMQNGGVEDDRTHSHLDLIARLSSLSSANISLPERSAFFSLVDYGAVFSRYPHHTLKTHENRRDSTALQWLLDSSLCSPQNFVKDFIQPALYCMETLLQSSEPISEVIVKEIHEVMERSSQSLPESSISNALRSKLKSHLTVIPILISKVEAIIAKVNASDHFLKEKIILALKEVQYHLQGINMRLNCFISFPQSIYLSAHVDAILTRLQYLDEQVEIALHMINSGEIVRMHHLQHLRDLRGDQEIDSLLEKTVHDLDIAGGAQYVHFVSNALRARGVTASQMPRALTWRIDALNISLHDCEEGMSIPVKDKVIAVETLRNQIAMTIMNVLDMTKTRLDEIQLELDRFTSQSNSSQS